MPQMPGVPDQRPEPVVDAAKLGGLLSALLVAVGGVIALLSLILNNLR